MQSDIESALIGVNLLAERLQLSRRTIHRILARGELPSLQIGRRRPWRGSQGQQKRPEARTLYRRGGQDEVLGRRPDKAGPRTGRYDLILDLKSVSNQRRRRSAIAFLGGRPRQARALSTGPRALTRYNGGRIVSFDIGKMTFNGRFGFPRGAFR